MGAYLMASFIGRVRKSLVTCTFNFSSVLIFNQSWRTRVLLVIEFQGGIWMLEQLRPSVHILCVRRKRSSCDISFCTFTCNHVQSFCPYSHHLVSAVDQLAE